MRTQPIEALSRLLEQLDLGCPDRGFLARELVRLGAAHAVVIADLGRDLNGAPVTRGLAVQARDGRSAEALLGVAARGPLPALERPEPRILEGVAAPSPTGSGLVALDERVLGPEARFVVADELEVHTWLGLFGAPGSSGLTRPWRSALNRELPTLRRLLEASRVPIPSAEGAVVLDGDGQVVAADAEVLPWLDVEARRTRLPTLLRVGRHGDAVDGPLDGARLRLRAGQGRWGPLWLGAVERPRTLERSLESLLTPTQREVAGYAAVGATCAEIATTLGTRVETVRTHVRDIYARLGISTRAELARRWAPILGT